MSKPYLKQVNIVNVEAMSEHGELYTAEKKIQIVVEEEKKYFLTWQHMMALLLDLNSLFDVKLMTWISQNVNYNDNTVSLNKFYKKKIMDDTGAGRSTIEKSISSLTAVGFLVRDTTCIRCGMYHVNPSYIWYGDHATRDGKLKIVLEMMQYEKLPEKEKQIADDIKRRTEYEKKIREKKLYEKSI